MSTPSSSSTGAPPTPAVDLTGRPEESFTAASGTDAERALSLLAGELALEKKSHKRKSPAPKAGGEPVAKRVRVSEPSRAVPATPKAAALPAVVETPVAEVEQSPGATQAAKAPKCDREPKSERPTKKPVVSFMDESLDRKAAWSKKKKSKKSKKMRKKSSKKKSSKKKTRKTKKRGKKSKK